MYIYMILLNKVLICIDVINYNKKTQWLGHFQTVFIIDLPKKKNSNIKLQKSTQIKMVKYVDVSLLNKTSQPNR